MSIEYENNILNLKDYKLDLDNYYNPDSYISNFDSINNWNDFYYLKNWNKFFLIEYYAILIKLMYINL